MSDVRLTGGCQCGAVRYAVHETPYQVGICHCRMCQKAAGAPYFATFTVKNASLDWTRGTPAVFRSSEKMERGFCRDCGTPLYNNWVANDVIHPAIGTLDDPSAVSPEFQGGTEAQARVDRRHSLVDGDEHRRHLQGLRGALRRDQGDQPPAPRPRHRGVAAGGAGTRMTATPLTGGCQCGAVRFRVDESSAAPRSAIAGCARRRSARLYGPLVDGTTASTWTRGAPKYFQQLRSRASAASAQTAARRSPIEDLVGDVELAIGAFDDPTAAAPVDPGDPRDKLAFRRRRLPGLPVRGPASRRPASEEFNARVINHQHPDHDTDGLAARGSILRS